MYEFKDCHALSVEDIDAQHREAFSLSAELHAALDAGPQVVEGVLARLSDHFQVHFQCEEQLMKEIKFPGWVEHKKLHWALMVRLGGLRADLQSGRKVSAEEILGFLRDWVSHQTGSDMAMLPYIQTARVASALAKWAKHTGGLAA